MVGAAGLSVQRGEGERRGGAQPLCAPAWVLPQATALAVLMPATAAVVVVVVVSSVTILGAGPLVVWGSWPCLGAPRHLAASLQTDSRI